MVHRLSIMAKLAPPATMKSPVRAARSRSGRTAGSRGPTSQELFSEEQGFLSRTPEPRASGRNQVERDLKETLEDDAINTEHYRAVESYNKVKASIGGLGWW